MTICHGSSLPPLHETGLSVLKNKPFGTCPACAQHVRLMTVWKDGLRWVCAIHHREDS